ncbi:hypothetical protein, partial [Marinospirillum perlucidum]|uniref:hypothetical protein n=1 Tax=Marinospirillum perlucidum TaxID=1982602 RepID=UPI001C49B654
SLTHLHAGRRKLSTERKVNQLTHQVGQFYWPKVGQNKWPLTPFYQCLASGSSSLFYFCRFLDLSLLLAVLYKYQYQYQLFWRLFDARQLRQ